MLLYYIRHGDPIYDPDSLTPLGHRQAEALAKRLAVHGIDRIYASSSNRAIQTAQPTCEMVKKEMTVLDWCSEVHAWRELTTVTEDGKEVDYIVYHANLTSGTGWTGRSIFTQPFTWDENDYPVFGKPEF